MTTLVTKVHSFRILILSNFCSLGQDTQDGVEMVTLDNTDDSSNQGEVYELKFGKPLREQDRFLPIANIAKIMKKSIPDGGKVCL
jgi:nuclear transcription Y subunit beta